MSSLNYPNKTMFQMVADASKNILKTALTALWVRKPLTGK